jgi:hypothetical protein
LAFSEDAFNENQFDKECVGQWMQAFGQLRQIPVIIMNGGIHLHF